MPTVTAVFDTRRDAELAVEHLVQEHGVERDAIVVGADGDENTAGTRLNGADRGPDGEDDTSDSAAIDGSIAVAVTIEDDDEELFEALQEVLEDFGGADVTIAD